MRNKVFGLCFIALLAVTFAQAGKAQRRIDSVQTTTSCYRDAVTPITIVPTLHSDMPLDCMLGYIYFDSLCRSIRYWQVDSLLAQIKPWDTLRTFMRLLYRMQEYDADLFEEYSAASADLDLSYQTAASLIVYHLEDSLESYLGRYNKLVYMIEAPVILRIHVADTFSSNDSGARIPVYPLPMKCVSALVMEQIKGKNIRCEPEFISANKPKGAAPQGEHCFIHITYSTFSQKLHPRGDVNVVTIKDGHAYTTCDSCYSSDALQPGKDYIVFLEDRLLDYDGTNAYYEYSPYTTFSNEGGIFQIDSSGNVQIPSDFFGYGTSVPLTMFETLLHADLNSFLSH